MSETLDMTPQTPDITAMPGPAMPGPTMPGPVGPEMMLPPRPIDPAAARWGGELVLAPPPVESDWTALDKTDAEMAVPSAMGDVMQFGRVMQMAVLSAVFSLDMRPAQSQPQRPTTLEVFIRHRDDDAPTPGQASLN